MMKIDLVTVGKLKKDFHKTAFEYYLKRAGKYFKINLVEKNKRSSRRAHDRIVNVGKGGSEKTFSIVLDESGEEYSTSMLVELIKKLQVSGHRSVSFYFGGPFGLDNEFKNGADKIVSLSRMTMTHELARVMLIEQIYRCGTILAGEKYHK